MTPSRLLKLAAVVEPAHIRKSKVFGRTAQAIRKWLRRGRANSSLRNAVKASPVLRRVSVYDGEGLEANGLSDNSQLSWFRHRSGSHKLMDCADCAGMVQFKAVRQMHHEGGARRFAWHKRTRAEMQRSLVRTSLEQGGAGAQHKAFQAWGHQVKSTDLQNHTCLRSGSGMAYNFSGKNRRSHVATSHIGWLTFLVHV